MARKTILDTYYTFNPTTRTIVIPRAIPKERLVIITDVTQNIVLYNFSDANLKTTAYNIATDPTGAYTNTTIVLNYNTSGLSSTDKLQIIVDEYDEKFTPSETYLDAVNKLRVSQPQSLIDTDYEYSTQATKWENLALINNRPFAYWNFNTPLTYTDIRTDTTAGTRTFTVSTTTPPPVGQPVAIIDTLNPAADGLYVVDSIVAGTSFSYTGKFNSTLGTNVSINNVGTTAIYQGVIFNGSQIPLSNATTSGTQVTVTTAIPHGLVIGNEIAVTGTVSSASPPYANGSYTVTSVPSPTTFVYYTANAPGTITIAPTAFAGYTMTGRTVLGVSGLANLPTNVAAGQLVSGNNIPANTYVTSLLSNTFGGTAISNTNIMAVGVTFTGNPIVPGMTVPISPYPYVLYQATSTFASAATIGVTTGPATGSSNAILMANVNNVAVGQIVSGTNIPQGSFVGAISGLYVSLINYLGAPVVYLGVPSGNLDFKPVGNIGTYILSASVSITPVSTIGIQISNPATGSGAVATITPAANLFVKPSGHIAHRPYDGGVRFSTNASSHNNAFYRQTRRYFRYQSGKAIQMSTGTTMKPQMSIDGLTSSGTLVTVTTKDPHNINSGVIIQIAGADQPQYNGQFPILNVLSPYQFTYTAASTPNSTVATGTPQGSVVNWYGNQNRIGIYDTMNGMFFEYDGQQLWAVVRSSTYQLFGSIAITVGATTSHVVNGTNTIFSKQVTPGDFVVIRGMSYRVLTINSDTQLTITPPFRGTASIATAQIMKTVERRVPQSAFNTDRLDGTGPSGMTLDLSRMQMFYIDYSWYGTGFIRFGIRGTDGNVIYVHRFINNNSQYLAYMRSGNLPGRYESNTYSKVSIGIPNTGIANSTGSILSTDSSVYLSNTYGWPTSGIALIRNSTQTEYVNYTGISAVASKVFNTVAGSTTLTLAAGDTSNLVIGQYVSGPYIPAGTTVQAINANLNIVISSPAILTATNVTYLFNPQLTGLTRAQAGVVALASCGTTAGSNTVTVTANTGLQIGQYVIGTGVPNQSYITVISGTNITVSQAATATGSASLTFAPMAGTAQAFSITTTAVTSVELHAPQFASEVNHWGTSAIMDGQFTNDKQFVFTKGMTNLITVPTYINAAIMSFRIAPSASNGIPATSVGLREIITRMQFIMQQADILTNGNYLMTLVLNAQTIDLTAAGSLNWANVGGSSLSQYIIHNPNTTVVGGETIFGFYLNTGAGGTSYQSTQQDLTIVRDLGTSILGGGVSTPTIGIYPDGPDVITICAQNLGSTTSNIQARLSWVEAQA